MVWQWSANKWKKFVRTMNIWKCLWHGKPRVEYLFWNDRKWLMLPHVHPNVVLLHSSVKWPPLDGLGVWYVVMERYWSHKLKTLCVFSHLGNTMLQPFIDYSDLLQHCEIWKKKVNSSQHNNQNSIKTNVKLISETRNTDFVSSPQIQWWICKTSIRDDRWNNLV